MSTAMHLARPEDLDRLDALVAAFHAEAGIDSSAERREAGLRPLLEGSPYGAAYLIGPNRAPIGYVAISFGWSLEFGGLDAFVDELYLRPAVRRRGIATEVLTELPRALAGVGLRALHLEVSRADAAAQRLYQRAGFRAREGMMLMSKQLAAGGEARGAK